MRHTLAALLFAAPICAFAAPPPARFRLFVAGSGAKLNRPFTVRRTSAPPTLAA
jgi:hypothetical protein